MSLIRKTGLFNHNFECCKGVLDVSDKTAIASELEGGIQTSQECRFQSL